MAFQSEVVEVTFSDPSKGNGEDHAIEDKLIQLIEAAPAGSEIHGCISHFSREKPYKALMEAAQRGVVIRIIIREDNQDALSDMVPEIRAYFDADDPGKNMFPTYAYGSYGLRSHIKLFIFSESKLGTIRRRPKPNIRDKEDDGHTKWLVMAGSFLISDGGLKKHNDAFVVSDETLYNKVRSYLEELRYVAHPEGEGPVGENAVIVDRDLYSTSERVKVYLFPRSRDPIARIIRKLKVKPHKSTGEKPIIRVAMARWSPDRWAIVEALIEKLKKGCDVQLVLRWDPELDDDSGDDGVSNSIWWALWPGSNILGDQGVPWNGHLKIWRAIVDLPKKDVHNKYMLIKGYYGEGSDWEHLVWSGSENWSGPALVSNDEMLFKFSDAEMYWVYEAHHDHLKSLCVPWPSS